MDPASRLFRKTVQQGHSKRGGEAYFLPYVEPLSAARTPLAGFLNSLLVKAGQDRLILISGQTMHPQAQPPGEFRLIRNLEHRL